MSDFTRQLETFAAKSSLKADRVLRSASLEILKRVTMRSPVDTGRFLGNWQVGVDSRPDAILDTFDKAGNITVSMGEEELLSARIGKTVFIANNLPYGPRLETGWSERAPNGMIGITVAEWQGIVADAVMVSK